MRRTPPQLELERLYTDLDGEPVREAGVWAMQKLAIVTRYASRFTTACKAARGGVYVDPFAGPGINVVRDSGRSIWGSAMLALRTQPPFAQLYLSDIDVQNVEALRRRIGGDRRANLHVGDANGSFLQFVAPALRSRAPMFCLLDPQGIELQWSTVAALGQQRSGAHRSELLILFSDRMGFMRLLPKDGDPSHAVVRNMDHFFGRSDWQDIYRRKQTGLLAPAEARRAYVALYEQGLRDLGYPYVAAREVRDHGVDGRPLYQLLFATESDAGNRIMTDIFTYLTPLRPQLPLALL